MLAAMHQHSRHRINAGRTAVKSQIEFFHAQLGQVRSEWKADDTRVTFADFAISEKIFAELRKSFPQDEFFSEESNPLDEVTALESRYAWLLDPIDGTNNYVLGMPLCGISLALLKDGVPVYGIIYDGMRRRLLQGGPETGVYDGCERVRHDPGHVDAQPIVAVNFPLPSEVTACLAEPLSRYRVRSLGSAALNLAYTATGVFAACLDFRSKPWDVGAAHALLGTIGLDFHFVEDDAFPMRMFHPTLGACPFIAGRPAFCRELLDCLNAKIPSAKNAN